MESLDSLCVGGIRGARAGFFLHQNPVFLGVLLGFRAGAFFLGLGREVSFVVAILSILCAAMNCLIPSGGAVKK